jgi:hypothetical protein
VCGIKPHGDGAVRKTLLFTKKAKSFRHGAEVEAGRLDAGHTMEARHFAFIVAASRPNRMVTRSLGATADGGKDRRVLLICLAYGLRILHGLLQIGRSRHGNRRCFWANLASPTEGIAVAYAQTIAID